MTVLVPVTMVISTARLKERYHPEVFNPLSVRWIDPNFLTFLSNTSEVPQKFVQPARKGKRPTTSKYTHTRNQHTHPSTGRHTITYTPTVAIATHDTLPQRSTMTGLAALPRSSAPRSAVLVEMKPDQEDGSCSFACRSFVQSIRVHGSEVDT